jgi:tRNA (guanine37-N1)-methyltransferase
MMGLRVPKNYANEIRKILSKHSLLNFDLKIKHTNDFVFFPLDNIPNEKIYKKFRELGIGIIDTDFEKFKRLPKSLKDCLKGKIEDKKIDEINKSYDVIGDIVILEIGNDLENEKNLIGEAALKFTKKKSVYRKIGKTKGVSRLRELEIIAGDDISETFHREHGNRFMLDVKKVFFSPRLATERERILEQVKDGEIIIDMFTGVGPFAISMARKHDIKVYAVDINPKAFYYLKKNITLNKVNNKVIPILGNASEFLDQNKIQADRIIMNLPGKAYNFLKSAIDSLKTGGILHYYEFASDFKETTKRLETVSYPRRVKILNKKRVRSISPCKWHIGIDAMIL